MNTAKRLIPLIGASIALMVLFRILVPGFLNPENLVDLVQQTVARARLCDSSGQLRIGVALREALLNALLHGNLEISLERMDEAREQLMSQQELSIPIDGPVEEAFLARRIFVNVRISTEEARFVIRDEGPGFDVSSVPTSWAPGGLEKKGSRSLSLMRAFMDEVVYNEAGNEVTLVKRKEEEKTAEAPYGIDV